MSRPTFDRSDTLLGVCEALGQDLGFNADWLRVALAVGIFWNPMAMMAAYLGLGIAVAAARLLTPEGEAVAVAPEVRAEADNDDEGQIMLAEAA